MNISQPVLSASSICDDKVKNAKGEDLGDIKDLMIDTETGMVRYAVLSFGGFLGLGDKYFAVPWESMEVNTDDHTFILNVEKERLKNAPGFDKDNWPDMADPQFHKLVYGHYGVDYRNAA